MISDRDQRAFLEFARPPAGMRLAYCVGTTFTLDFTVLVQLALATQGETKAEEALDLPAAFKKLYEFESRSIVFCQSCRIQHIPPEFFQPQKTPRQRLLSLLDASIHAVKTSEPQGTFHPKVWLLRFDANENHREPVWRLLVTSRNLSEANTWEIGAELEGARVQPSASRNVELRQFLATLLANSPENDKGRRIIKRAREDLAGVEFRINHPFKEWSFLVKSGVDTAFDILDEQRYRKIIAVSPFLSKTALAKLAKVSEAVLITDLKDVKHIEHSPSLQPNTYLFKLDGLPLHAKAYLCLRRDGRGTDIFLGSANLTRAGMFKEGRNVEAVLKLQTDQDLVADFEKKFVFENAKARKLYPWLFRLHDDDLEQSAAILESEERSRVLEEVRAQLSSGTFQIKRAGKHKWSIKWYGSRIVWPGDVSATVWFSEAGEGYDLHEILDGKAVFLVGNHTPSAFVRIRLWKKGAGELEFGSVAEVVGGSRRRSEEVLEQVAQTTEFGDMLKAILGDGARDMVISAVTDGDSKTYSARSRSQARARIDGYVEALLLADLDSESQRELIASIIETYAKADNPQAQALQAFWLKLTDALKEVAG